MTDNVTSTNYSSRPLTLKQKYNNKEKTPLPLKIKTKAKTKNTTITNTHQTNKNVVNVVQCNESIKIYELYSRSRHLNKKK